MRMVVAVIVCSCVVTAAAAQTCEEIAGQFFTAVREEKVAEGRMRVTVAIGSLTPDLSQRERKKPRCRSVRTFRGLADFAQVRHHMRVHAVRGAEVVSLFRPQSRISSSEKPSCRSDNTCCKRATSSAV